MSSNKLYFLWLNICDFANFICSWKTSHDHVITNKKLTNFRLHLQCITCGSRSVKTVLRVTPIKLESTINKYCGNPFCRMTRKQSVIKVI